MRNTNVYLQPDAVYTLFLITSNDAVWDFSNAFRLSLTYGTTATPLTTSSTTLSSGAIAGIVIAAVVVALVLVLVVVFLVRRQLSGGPSKSGTSDGVQWSMRSGTGSSSDDYKDVELQ